MDAVSVSPTDGSEDGSRTNGWHVSVLPYFDYGPKPSLKSEYIWVVLKAKVVFYIHTISNHTFV